MNLIPKLLTTRAKMTLTPEEVAQLDPLERLYYRLWSRFGGRYWTWILRDFAHKYVWLAIIICAGVSGVVACKVGFAHFCIGLAILAFGILLGHLYATRYIPNQGTDQEGQWTDQEDLGDNGGQP